MKYAVVVLALLGAVIYYYFSTRAVILKDSANNLMWQIQSPGNHAYYEDVEKYCKSMDLEGFNDWRVPTLKELRTVIRDCPKTEKGGSCMTTFCTGCVTDKTHCYRVKQLQGLCGRYWGKKEGQMYGAVDFTTGAVIEVGPNATMLGKCVRSIK